ncbi:ferritin-like domain-containing protein [Paraliobacillus ryukyuensis]|nr:ferritin-like domain-containing protein [Paraliobacillus ryukyuensis]
MMRDYEHAIRHLNQLLADLFVLHTKLHRYRWYIKGTNFFTLTDFFYDFCKEVAQDIDEIGVFILTIDGQPFATMETFLEHATLKEAQADDTETEIIDQLIADLQMLDKQITSFVPSEQEKSVVHLFYQLRTKYNKRKWMLQTYQTYHH